MSHPVLRPLAAAIGALSAFAASAAPEQVLVSATRFEQTAVAIPANILVIDAAAIERSGAKTLTELLRSRAGIQAQDVVGSGARGTTLVMRGFGSNAANNTLVLLDGQKLNNPSLVAPDLSSIALADVERIEIVQGSAGVLFGDQATGGVINVITKRPQQRSARLEAGMGSQDWESYSGSIGEAFDNGLAYRVAGEKRLSDNYRDNNEAGYDNLLARASYAQALFSGFVEAQQINDDMRLPGSLTPAQIREDRRQSRRPADFTDIDTERYRVGGELVIDPNWKIAVDYSYRDADSEGVFFGMAFTDATTVKSFSPRVLGNVELPYGNLVATFGYDNQHSDYRSTLTFNRVEQRSDDVYGQLVVPVYTDVAVTAGLRRSRIEQENLTAGNIHDDSESLHTLGVSWQSTDALRVFARFDSNFRWANADENGFTLAGVDFLKPQTSDSYEAGFNWRAGALETDLVIYRLDTDNELLFDPAQNFGFGANINLQRSRRDGANAELRWAVSDALSVRASAGYVDAEVRAGDYRGNAVPFAAKQTGSIGVEWRINAMFDLYADAQYTGRRFRSGDDPNQLGELGGYTIYNANLRWHRDRWYATLRVNNLTATEYEGFSGVSISSFGIFEFAYPAAERETFVTVGYTF